MFPPDSGMLPMRRHRLVSEVSSSASAPKRAQTACSSRRSSAASAEAMPFDSYFKSARRIEIDQQAGRLSNQGRTCFGEILRCRLTNDECAACGHHFERRQKMSEPPVSICPECGSSVKRLISGGAGAISKGGIGSSSADRMACDRGGAYCGQGGGCCPDMTLED
jgi:putative FmdB family regulatory protein